MSLDSGALSAAVGEHLQRTFPFSPGAEKDAEGGSSTNLAPQRFVENSNQQQERGEKQMSMRQPQRRRQAGSGKGFFAGVGEAFSRFFGFLESRAWREGLVNLLQMLVAFTGTFMLVFDPLRKTVAQLLKVEPSTSIGFDIKVTGLVFIVLAVIANFMEFFELRGRIVHVRGEKEELVDNLYIVLVLGSAWVSNFTVNVADPSSTHKMLVLLTAGYGLLQLVWIIFTAGGGEEEERPL